jgi:hypothetical protein
MTRELANARRLAIAKVFIFSVYNKTKAPE